MPEKSPPLIAPPPNNQSRWLQVDGAAAYMGNVSRKTVYAAVAAGMRVARLGDGPPRRDRKGRLWQGRMLFNTAWIDEYLEGRASCHPLTERVADAGKSLIPNAQASRPEGQIATRLQQRTEMSSEVAPCTR